MKKELGHEKPNYERTDPLSTPVPLHLECDRVIIVSAVAVLYYLRNWQEAITNMFDLLEPGGVLFITLNSGDCGFANIWTKFPMLADDASNLVHINQVTKFLGKKGIGYDVIEGISYMDISSCFKEGIDTKGDMLLDFLAHIKNFRKTAPPTLLDGFLDFLKGPECCKIDDDGRFMLNEGWGAIVVQKK
ncbi:putative histamine N-methyltransferase-like [Apostichopus japonicus]|uniref:Putative histamine N-methyltransferase-like n=1 Tax=Stichopus japonicus TaxID=307972 RepID=A0A2G8KIP7_STIJA|nr:putative histamine N-methyltransferase-like [Apostichopus japonicus]